MNSFKNLVLPGLFLIFIFSVPAFSLPEGKGAPDFGPGFGPPPEAQKEMKRHKRPNILDAISKKLNLTDLQKSKISEKDNKAFESEKIQMSVVRDLNEKIKSEMKKDSPDRGKIHEYMGKINDAHFKMQVARMDFMLDLREILTKEQKDKFDNMIEKDMKRFDKKREKSK